MSINCKNPVQSRAMHAHTKWSGSFSFRKGKGSATNTHVQADLTFDIAIVKTHQKDSWSRTSANSTTIQWYDDTNEERWEASCEWQWRMCRLVHWWGVHCWWTRELRARQVRDQRCMHCMKLHSIISYAFTYGNFERQKNWIQTPTHGRIVRKRESIMKPSMA